jgi:hypothetical protein
VLFCTLCRAPHITAMRGQPAHPNLRAGILSARLP